MRLDSRPAGRLDRDGFVYANRVAFVVRLLTPGGVRLERAVECSRLAIRRSHFFPQFVACRFRALRRRARRPAVFTIAGR
jgi:hypothetical protein